MALSRKVLHNPLVRPPTGPRTRDHIPASLLPLSSNRNAHIVRLYDVLTHLISLPPSPETHTRSVRAWRALTQCPEVHVEVLWALGAAVIDRTREKEPRGGEGDDDGDDARWRAGQRAEWLKYNQDGTHDRVKKFHEYILALVAAGRAEFALDELESYLDNQPYHDSIALNTLYGLLALLLAQPPSLSGASASSSAGSDSDSSSDEESARRRRRGGRPSKRAKRDGEAASAQPGDEYGDLLRSIALNSPSLLSKATERLRRAAHLEERVEREAGQQDGHGEAARWLALIRRHTEGGTRRESPF
ncbi:hypothetical protein JCM10449v2_006093 [Rhodotorula kratochvilovae]